MKRTLILSPEDMLEITLEDTPLPSAAINMAPPGFICQSPKTHWLKSARS